MPSDRFPTRRVTVVLVLLAVAAPVVLFGGTKNQKAIPAAKVSVNELVRDSQKMGDEPDKVTLVWWIPTEYWKASLSKNQAITEQQITKMTTALEPYLVLVVVKGDISDVANVRYDSEDEILSAVKLKDSAGKVYDPVEPSVVSDDAEAVFKQMRPAFGQMLGAMGRNMVFVTFKNKTDGGKPIADATADGKFTILWGDDQKYPFRTPLPSLVAKKRCPTCHEKLPGNYDFCPYDGKKLEDAEK